MQGWQTHLRNYKYQHNTKTLEKLKIDNEQKGNDTWVTKDKNKS